MPPYNLTFPAVGYNKNKNKFLNVDTNAFNNDTYWFDKHNIPVYNPSLIDPTNDYFSISPLLNTDNNNVSASRELGLLDAANLVNHVGTNFINDKSPSSVLRGAGYTAADIALPGLGTAMRASDSIINGASKAISNGYHNNTIDNISKVYDYIPGGKVMQIPLAVGNRLFGSKLNKSYIDSYNNELNNYNKWSSTADDYDVLSADLSRMPELSALSGAKVGSDGPGLFGMFKPNKAKKEYDLLSRKTDETNKLRSDKIDTAIGNVAANQNRNMSMNYRSNFACGGRLYDDGGALHVNGLDFSNPLTYINEGGSHEMNPNQGVPVSINQQDGQPNLVEEGETIANGDYVFSNRIQIPDEVAKKLRVPKGKTFAEASKLIAKESEELPSDPIIKRALDENMMYLQAAQEQVKQQQAEQEKAIQAILTGQYADGGTINIKKENKGLFTKAAKRAGMSTQEYARHILANKDDYSTTLVKRANFARNAAGWQHGNGGHIFAEGTELNPETTIPPIQFIDGQPVWVQQSGNRKLVTPVGLLSPYTTYNEDGTDLLVSNDNPFGLREQDGFVVNLPTYTVNASDGLGYMIPTNQLTEEEAKNLGYIHPAGRDDVWVNPNKTDPNVEWLRNAPLHLYEGLNEGINQGANIFKNTIDNFTSPAKLLTGWNNLSEDREYTNTLSKVLDFITPTSIEDIALGEIGGVVASKLLKPLIKQGSKTLSKYGDDIINNLKNRYNLSPKFQTVTPDGRSVTVNNDSGRVTGGLYSLFAKPTKTTSRVDEILNGRFDNVIDELEINTKTKEGRALKKRKEFLEKSKLRKDLKSDGIDIEDLTQKGVREVFKETKEKLGSKYPKRKISKMENEKYKQELKTLKKILPGSGLPKKWNTMTPNQRRAARALLGTSIAGSGLGLAIYSSYKANEKNENIIEQQNSNIISLEDLFNTSEGYSPSYQDAIKYVNDNIKLENGEDAETYIKKWLTPSQLEELISADDSTINGRDLFLNFMDDNIETALRQKKLPEELNKENLELHRKAQLGEEEDLLNKQKTVSRKQINNNIQKPTNAQQYNNVKTNNSDNIFEGSSGTWALGGNLYDIGGHLYQTGGDGTSNSQNINEQSYIYGDADLNWDYNNWYNPFDWGNTYDQAKMINKGYSRNTAWDNLEPNDFWKNVYIPALKNNQEVRDDYIKKQKEYNPGFFTNYNVWDDKKRQQVFSNIATGKHSFKDLASDQKAWGVGARMRARVGKRYKDEDGHWINPKDLDKYVIIDDGVIQPLDKKLGAIWTDYTVRKKDNPNNNSNNKIINKNNATDTDVLKVKRFPLPYVNDSLRYAPIGINTASLLYNTRPVDYTSADAYEQYAREIGNPVNIPVSTIGNYRRRNPFDEEYITNIINQNNAANARMGYNISGGNRAMQMGAQAARDIANQQALSQNAYTAYTANRKDDEDVSTFNRYVDMNNNSAINSRNQALANLNSNRDLASKDALIKAALYRQGLKDQRDAALARDLSQLSENLSGLGKENWYENYIRKMINWGVMEPTADMLEEMKNTNGNTKNTKTTTKKSTATTTNSKKNSRRKIQSGIDYIMAPELQGQSRKYKSKEREREEDKRLNMVLKVLRGESLI